MLLRHGALQDEGVRFRLREHRPAQLAAPGVT
jgi:hypothetical protein